MPGATLRLLGVPTVVLDGRATPLPTHTPASLLVYLAVAGDWVPRTELAYLYRPDEPEGAALQYLRLQVHRAQRLAWAADLEVAADRVRWSPTTDLAGFDDAIGRQDWTAAVSGYGGPLLAGYATRGQPTFEAWLELERGAVERRYRGALEASAAALESRGRYAEAVVDRERAAALDPFDETAHRSLLRTLAAAGRREDARRRHAQFVQRLADELGGTPEAATEELVRGLADPGVPMPPARLPAVAALPRPATRFVGRRHELGEVRALLGDPECRLLTLIGIGGTGKTRLALEAARPRAGGYADGACFASGADVRTVAQLQERIAHAFGIALDAERDVGAALTTALTDRSALLVLDNLEHLPDAAPWVAQLLEAAPAVRVLATARTPLRLGAEWTYEVGGLPCVGDADDRPAEAIELFVAAVRRVAPSLEVGDGDREAAERICRSVDGLPLAIELAAGWARAMPIGGIADALGQGFDLLTTERVDVPERHRSLLAVLDRTWADLTPAQREALERLSAFVAPCTLHAAERVTGAATPLLLSLVNRSLVQRAGTDRFACHPLVAQYASRLRHADPERDAAIRDAHAAFVLGRLEAAVAAGDAAVPALDPDVPDLERAWTHLLDRADAPRLARFAHPFFHRYDVRGTARTGLALGEATLARWADARPGVGVRAWTEVRARVALAMAALSREAGDLQRAARHAEDARAVATDDGADALIARADQYLGDVRQQQGAFDEAEAAYGRAVATFEALGERRALADALNSLGSMEAVLERYDAAAERFRRCVALFAAEGAALDEAIARSNLGYVAEARGANDEAARSYEAARTTFEAVGFQRGIAAVQNNLVVLYGKLGRLADAEAAGAASLALKASMGDALGSVITLKNLGDLHLLQDAPDAALSRYLPALRAALDLGAVPRLIQVLVGCGDALARIGEAALAADALAAVAGHPSAPTSLAERARSLALTAGLPCAPHDGIERAARAILERSSD
jgi:DNA-binding SARP family transcriptional activator